MRLRFDRRDLDVVQIVVSVANLCTQNTRRFFDLLVFDVLVGVEASNDEKLLFAGTDVRTANGLPTVDQGHDFVGFVQDVRRADQESRIALLHFAVAEHRTDAVYSVAGQVTEADVK